MPEGILVYDIAGPLFFGAAQRAMGTLGTVADKTRAVILRMEDVPVIDATGLVALESALDTLDARGCTAILSGLQRQPARLIDKDSVLQSRKRIVVCHDFEAAVTVAKEVLASPPSRRPSVPPAHA